MAVVLSWKASKRIGNVRIYIRHALAATANGISNCLHNWLPITACSHVTQNYTWLMRLVVASSFHVQLLLCRTCKAQASDRFDCAYSRKLALVLRHCQLQHSRLKLVLSQERVLLHFRLDKRLCLLCPIYIATGEGRPWVDNTAAVTHVVLWAGNTQERAHLLQTSHRVLDELLTLDIQHGVAHALDFLHPSNKSAKIPASCQIHNSRIVQMSFLQIQSREEQSCQLAIPSKWNFLYLASKN